MPLNNHTFLCRHKGSSAHFCSALSTPSVRQRTTPAGMASRMSNSASSVSVTILMVSTTDLHLDRCGNIGGGGHVAGGMPRQQSRLGVW